MGPLDVVSILKDQHTILKIAYHDGPKCTFKVFFLFFFSGCQIFKCFMNSFKLSADNYVLPFLSRRRLLHL